MVSIAVSQPALQEQRLDVSGVDGESVWMAQSSKPEDDAVGFVQPSVEIVDKVVQISDTAGSRPVLLVNPQWKERDDPLDALSRKVTQLIGTSSLFAHSISAHTIFDPGYLTPPGALQPGVCAPRFWQGGLLGSLGNFLGGKV